MDQLWIVEMTKRARSLVTAQLKQLGCTVVDTWDTYCLCRGPQDLPAHLNPEGGAVRVYPVAGEPATAAPAPVAVGDLVTLHLGEGLRWTGRLAAIHGTQATVHVWCFGRAVSITVPLEKLTRFELPEAWR
jgi:hypothetical protein